MHITSLPSPYGIGTMGKAAYEFVDFLEESGQSWWQILPLGQTGFGDSPYQSASAFAGNPYMIDLDLLKEDGYLTAEEIEAVDWGEDPTQVDYAGLYEKRYPLLRLAFQRFQENIHPDYDPFCWEQGQWLEDYALYMAIKRDLSGASWDTWEKPIRLREPEAIEEAKRRLGVEMFFWKMIQFFFFRQWRALKAYANGKDIKIIGDIPIYCAFDSADVWAQPWLFDLDAEGKPVEVAGCPPDAFSDDGQLWGNPLYRWDIMRRDGYSWWMNRIKHNLGFYDMIRIDHFRGFDAYYCIPYGDKNARRGCWRQGPGMDFFRMLKWTMGTDVPLIAEDLGYLTPSVRRLLADTGYPGMKVLQFAFDSGSANEYLPHHHRINAIIYTGTHDNDTNIGWWKGRTFAQKQEVCRWLRMGSGETPNHAMMRAAMESVCDTAILTMQDLLELGTEARMNEPSTAGKNWKWRAKEGYLTKELVKKLRRLTEAYDRLPKAEATEEIEDPLPLGAKIPSTVREA